jgi:hypothetical protein
MSMNCWMYIQQFGMDALNMPPRCDHACHPACSSLAPLPNRNTSAQVSWHYLARLFHADGCKLMPTLVIHRLLISCRSVAPSLKLLHRATLQRCLQQAPPVSSNGLRQQQFRLQSHHLRLQQNHSAHAHRVLHTIASMKDDPEGVTAEASLLEAFSEVPAISGAWVHCAGSGHSTLTVRHA